MKKVIYSAIASLLVLGSLTASVYAGTNSLIGKKVQSVISVTVNGKQVKDAIVIDGTTYAPVRSFSEAAGYSIAFDKGGVNLKSQTEAEIINQILTDNKLSTLRKSVTMWSAQLEGEQEVAAQARASLQKLDGWNASSPDDVPKLDKSDAQEKLNKAEATIADLQSKITAAEAEIRDLEAQLNDK